MSEKEELLAKYLDFAVGCRLPTDKFFDEGNKLIKHLKKYGIFETDSEDLLHEPVPLFSCNSLGCTKTFDTVYEYEQHYNSSHRYSCDTCKKSLTSPHLLDLHVSEAHDSFFAVQSEKKPMFRCYLEECNSIFYTPPLRKNHCIKEHNFPSNFHIDKSIVLPASVAKRDCLKMDVEKTQKPKDNSKTFKKKNTKKNDLPGATERMDAANEIPEKISRNKYLGSGNRRSRQKIFVSFEKDMIASLPPIEPSSNSGNTHKI